MKIRAVYKVLLIPGHNVIELPGDWKPLHVDNQDNAVCLWALVSPDDPKYHTKSIYVIATGLRFNYDGMKFIGTITNIGERNFVAHVFENEWMNDNGSNTNRGD